MTRPTINARQTTYDDGLAVTRPILNEHADILTPDALRFVCGLVRRFRTTRSELLKLRIIRQREIDAGVFPGFLRETASIRSADWRVTTPPLSPMPVRVAPAADYAALDRCIRAGGLVIADFEDSASPTWMNCVEGQINVRDAVARARPGATLAVRPRGWHLDERHVRVDDQPVPAALFDFGLFFFHNAARLATSGTAPLFYLPKLEGHLEARLWKEVFAAGEDAFGLPPGTVRAAVLAETVLAAFELDEIVHELRDCCAGVDCGRWDYIFSFIKRFRNHASFLLPDRSRLGMSQHMLASYMAHTATVCERRGAPLLCSITTGDHTGEGVSAEDLLAVPTGAATEAGLRTNVNVGITYLESWLRGNGHVAIYGSMEDTATAEVSRAQVWQWIRHRVRLADRTTVTRDVVHDIISQELSAMERSMGAEAFRRGRFELAAKLFAELTETDEFPDFMTLLAYGYLD